MRSGPALLADATLIVDCRKGDVRREVADQPTVARDSEDLMGVVRKRSVDDVCFVRLRYR